MTTKIKTPAKKKTATAKEKVPLVLDRFQKGSEFGNMLEFLLDEKPHSVKEIQKQIQSAHEEGILKWKYMHLNNWGKESGFYSMVKTEDGKIQLTKTAKFPKSTK